jgi:DNA-binding CsgD family transcriptional regulator
MFYESKVDLLETTVAYFKAGLDQNELCVWAISDPVTELDAQTALHLGIPEFARHAKAGDLSITSGEQWRLNKDEFNLQRITGGWSSMLLQALDTGYSGLRISGNAQWLENNHWEEFCAYDRELGRSVAGRQIVLLCTQAQGRLTADVDYQVAARAHHHTIACHNGEWTFVDTNALKHKNDSALTLGSAVNQFSASLKKHEISLTHREKAVLALIIRGVSSKKGGQLLGISPRTIEFHRSNIMQKLDVRNIAELVHTVMRTIDIAGAA